MEKIGHIVVTAQAAVKMVNIVPAAQSEEAGPKVKLPLKCENCLFFLGFDKQQ